MFINPTRPDNPVAINFALVTLVVLAGGACFVLGIKPKEKNK